MFADVLVAVAAVNGFTVAELRGRDKTRRIAWARQDAMYLGRLLGRSTPQIGKALDGRDWTTIIYGSRRAAHRLYSDPAYQDRVHRCARLARKASLLRRYMARPKPAAPVLPNARGTELRYRPMLVIPWTLAREAKCHG